MAINFGGKRYEKNDKIVIQAEIVGDVSSYSEETDEINLLVRSIKGVSNGTKVNVIFENLFTKDDDYVQIEEELDLQKDVVLVLNASIVKK